MWENVLSRLLNDPVSVYLLSGDVVATIAVGFGIIWEHGPPDVRVVANWFVIGGIIGETLCSVLLFAYDANVIGAQNDKIIALEERFVPRHFGDKQGDKVRPILESSGIKRLDVIVFLAGATSDTQLFGNNICAQLCVPSVPYRCKYWNASSPDIGPVFGVMVSLRVDIDEIETRRVAGATTDKLIKAFRSVGIPAGWGYPIDRKQPAQLTGSEPWDEADVAPIRISVGTKP